MIYKRKNKAEAITQILILLIGIFAISWMLGSEVKEVSAAEPCYKECEPLGATTCRGMQDLWTEVFGESNNAASTFGRTIHTCREMISQLGTCRGKPVWAWIDTGQPCEKSTNQDTTPQETTPTDTNPSETNNQETTPDASTNPSDIVRVTPPEKITVNDAFTTVASIPSLVNPKLPEKTIDAVKKIEGEFKVPTVGPNPIDPNVLAKAPAQAIVNKGYSLSQFLFGKTGSVYDGGWTGVGGTSTVGAAGAIVVWSAVAFVIGRYVLGPVFGLDTQQSQSLGYALAAGTAVGLIATSHAILGASAVGGPVGLAIGAAVAFVMFAILGKKSSVDMITYNCLQWEAPSGKGLTPTQMTQRCKMCNDQKDFVCTEYQCKSLGQGCVLINNADEGTQLCIWNNTQDILPPIIKPWKKALLEDFTYTSDSAIGPTSKGVRVNYIGTQKVTTDGTAKCAPPFTPISFGVELNEPAKCKIAPENAPSYAEMADIFVDGTGLRKYNHTFIFSLPSAEAIAAENNTVVENGGKYEMYVRCEDANGNVNVASFEFKFCISQGPDVTPPLMIGTSIIDNTPIKYNQIEMPVELYVTDQTFTKANASCRWSHTDRNYNAMEYNMSCGHSILNMNAQLAYTCNATLTGLKDNQDNKIYFRCIDDLGNSNTQSRVLTLIGTTPLSITSFGPTGIIEGPSEVVGVNLSVETASGYDEGKAVCAFSSTGSSGSYIDFFYGYDVEPFSQSIHSQELGLSAGNYTYFLQCRDMGGNIVEKNISFSVRVDTTPPMIVRVYKDEGLNALKVITSEKAICVYDNFGCNYLFGDGTVLNTEDGVEHYVEWNPALDFYIKCIDQYGNMPQEGECNLEARPFDIVEAQ